IKRLKSLTVKKYRDASGLFTVEGAKLVEEALRSRFTVEQVVRRDEIGEEAMARITALSSPSPVLAVVKKPLPASHGASGLCLALDSVRDPGNMGTILRLSDWFGLDCIFASADSVEVYNPKVVQASMGAIFRKKLVYCDIAEKCRDFRSAGLEVFGTFLNGENIYAGELPSEGLIVLGNESNGISDAVAKECSRRITIPSFGGGSESLNVSIAAAITVSEFKGHGRWK
ncbi:MAG: RNA methyltransferase, partial [Bacteroidales bacterium]|nr:RNA methyltransferase [Bacteroidales bacterium]